MTWYIAALRKYWDFAGRSRRKEFWYFSLFNFLVFVMLEAVVIGASKILDIYALTFLSLQVDVFMTLMLVPSIAVSVRRLHDIGVSGWWYLLSLVPLINIFLIFMLFCFDSQPDSNQYGPNPKETAVASGGGVVPGQLRSG